MTQRGEGRTPEDEEDPAQNERGATGGEGPSAGDPEHNTTPPGNPETDDEAVARGEENIGRIAGR